MENVNIKKENRDEVKTSSPKKYTIPGQPGMGVFDTPEAALEALNKRFVDTQRALEEARRLQREYENRLRQYESRQYPEEEEELDIYDPGQLKKFIRKTIQESLQSNMAQYNQMQMIEMEMKQLENQIAEDDSLTPQEKQDLIDLQRTIMASELLKYLRQRMPKYERLSNISAKDFLKGLHEYFKSGKITTVPTIQESGRPEARVKTEMEKTRPDLQRRFETEILPKLKEAGWSDEKIREKYPEFTT